MKILAIDPGSKESAYVMYYTDDQSIVDHDKIPNEELLGIITSLAVGVDVCLIEMVQSYGLAVGRTVFETCLWAGRFTQALDESDINGVFYYGRPTIKGAIGGKTDAQVRASLRMRFCSCGSKGACKKGCKMHGLGNDERAALALAVAIEENPNLKEW